jgi:beta-mannosidase
LQDTALFITDEGSNGLKLHLVNDAPRSVRGLLQIDLYKLSQPVGRPLSKLLSIGPSSVMEINPIQLFDGFADLSYSYRFGPPMYDVMRVAFIRDGRGRSVEAFHFPLGLPNIQGDVGLSATAHATASSVEVRLESRCFAQAVHIEAPGYVVEGQYFQQGSSQKTENKAR